MWSAGRRLLRCVNQNFHRHSRNGIGKKRYQTTNFYSQMLIYLVAYCDARWRHWTLSPWTCCHRGRVVTVRIRYSTKGINFLRYRTTNVLICFDGAEQDWNIDVQMLLCRRKMYIFVVVNYIV